MKKILILAYDFPPYASAGALRPHFWAKYLAEIGHEVTVVTRQWDLPFGDNRDYIAESESNTRIIESLDNFRCIRSPYKPSLSNRIRIQNKTGFRKFVGKILSGMTEVLQFIIPIGPKKTILKEAQKAIFEYQPDYILATGDPFVLFKYASILAKKNNVSWCADYRDPWSQDLTVQGRGILKMWYRFHEKKIVKSASNIITVSEFLASNLLKIHSGRNIEIIPNGYDHITTDKFKSIKANNQVLKISIAGTIYPWNPIDSFIEELSKFNDSNKQNKIELHLFGINIADHINTLVDEKYPNLLSVVYVHPKIPYEDLIKKLASSDVLLLFNYYSSMGTKIYDYIGLNVKIMFCYSGDQESVQLKSTYYLAEEFEGISTTLQEDLIREKNAGIIIERKEDLARVFKQLVEEHKTNGFISNNTLNAEDLSRKGQTEKLSKMIESTI